MKKNILILLILISKISVSQSLSGSINYELKINNENYKFPINYLIVFKGDKSIEIPLKININKEEILETSNNSEIQKIKVLNSSKVPFIYKDFKNKELYNSESIFRNQYLINDTLNNFNWIISNEEKIIENYSCKKAKTKFRGREFEAWYAESIPISNGPWKFCGLPGLILEVYDTEKIYNFKLTGLNLMSKIDIENINIPIDYDIKDVISHKKFVEIYKNKEKEFESSSRVITQTENVSSSFKIKLPKRIELY